MPSKKVQTHTPIYPTRLRLHLSERETAERAGVARSTLRQVEAGAESASLQTFAAVGEALGLQTAALAFPAQEECLSDFSTVAASLKVVRDGPESWKIHFMDLVDEFRRTMDPRLILLPSTKDLPKNLAALLASIVLTLAQEAEMDVPTWAAKRHTLEEPWFVAGVESLKASALLEAPVAFRRNNIFVLQNFLERA